MKILLSKTIPFTLIMTCVAMLGFGQPGYAETPSDKTTMKEVKKEVHDLIEALKGYTADQREEAITKTKATLNRLDQQIDTLEERIDNKWNKMSKAARKKARANLKTLRAQRIKVAEWTGRLKGSSAHAWEHVKKGFSDSYESMYDAWREAMEAFDSGK